MQSVNQNATIIRNYIITLVVVAIASIGLAEFYQQSSQIEQQKRLDNYSRLVSAGLVSQTQGSVYR